MRRRSLALAVALVWPCGCAQQAAEGATGATTPAAPSHFVSPFAYEWFVRAELLRARGDLGSAIEAYRMVLADADDDPYVLSRLATALDEHGETEQAQAAATQARQSDACSEAAWLATAVLAARHAQLEGAYAAYEHAESCAPWSGMGPLALAELLRSRGQLARASAVLARLAARKVPASSTAARARVELALAASDAPAALEAARAWLQLDAAAATPLQRTAQLLLDTGKPALAASLLDQLPQRPELTALRVQALLAAGRLPAAESLLVGADPETLGGLIAAGRDMLALGRAQQALGLAQDALAHDASDCQALLLRGQAQLDLHDYVAAAESFATIGRASQLAGDARAGLAVALRAQGLPTLADEVAHAQ